jgi:alpha/beta superfamily hydrolase
MSKKRINNDKGEVLVVFSHGKESGPHGNKISSMRSIAEDLGFSTVSLDYTKCSNEIERVELLRSFLRKKEQKLILVGSSMGGYVSAAVANEIELEGLFLLCPAVYHYELEQQFYTPKTMNIALVHGWEDDIILPQSSIDFAREHKAELLLVQDGHRLKNSLQSILPWFKSFLEDLNQGED